MDTLVGVAGRWTHVEDIEDEDKQHDRIHWDENRQDHEIETATSTISAVRGQAVGREDGCVAGVYLTETPVDQD
jgi:hypothetical protein